MAWQTVAEHEISCPAVLTCDQAIFFLFFLGGGKKYVFLFPPAKKKKIAWSQVTAVSVPSTSRCTPKQCFVLLNRRTKNILVVLATTSMQHANVQDDKKVPCRYSFLFLVDLIINHNWITVTARELQLQNWNPFEIFWICCPSQMLLNYRRISYSWLSA